MNYPRGAYFLFGLIFTIGGALMITELSVLLTPAGMAYLSVLPLLLGLGMIAISVFFYRSD